MKNYQQGGQPNPQQEMITGVIQMLREVLDPANREAMALKKLQELKQEGIQIDDNAFMQEVMSDQQQQQGQGQQSAPSQEQQAMVMQALEALMQIPDPAQREQAAAQALEELTSQGIDINPEAFMQKVMSGGQEQPASQGQQMEQPAPEGLPSLGGVSSMINGGNVSRYQRGGTTGDVYNGLYDPKYFTNGIFDNTLNIQNSGSNYTNFGDNPFSGEVNKGVNEAGTFFNSMFPDVNKPMGEWNNVTSEEYRNKIIKDRNLVSDGDKWKDPKTGEQYSKNDLDLIAGSNYDNDKKGRAAYNEYGKGLMANMSALDTLNKMEEKSYNAGLRSNNQNLSRGTSSQQFKGFFAMDGGTTSTMGGGPIDGLATYDILAKYFPGLTREIYGGFKSADDARVFMDTERAAGRITKIYVPPNAVTIATNTLSLPVSTTTVLDKSFDEQYGEAKRRGLDEFIYKDSNGKLSKIAIKEAPPGAKPLRFPPKNGGQKTTTTTTENQSISRSPKFSYGGSTGLQQQMGYKDNSPYRNLPYQTFDTDTITMDGVSKPLLAIADNGMRKALFPNSGLHNFPGANKITEVPMAQDGGKINKYQDGSVPQNNGYSWSRGQSNNVNTITPPTRSSEIKENKKDANKRQEQINQTAKNILANKGSGEFTEEEVSILNQATQIKGLNKILIDDNIIKSNRAQDQQVGVIPTAEELAKNTMATGDKLRLFPSSEGLGRTFDDYGNPLKMLGDLVSGYGRIPKDVGQGNYGSAAFNAAMPLAIGAGAGIGAKGTGQFVNNLANPLAGMEDLVRYANPLHNPSSPRFSSEKLIPKNNFYTKIEVDEILRKKLALVDLKQDILKGKYGSTNLDEALSNNPDLYEKYIDYENASFKHKLVSPEYIKKVRNALDDYHSSIDSGAGLTSRHRLKEFVEGREDDFSPDQIEFLKSWGHDMNSPEFTGYLREAAPKNISDYENRPFNFKLRPGQMNKQGGLVAMAQDGLSTNKKAFVGNTNNDYIGENPRLRSLAAKDLNVVREKIRSLSTIDGHDISQMFENAMHNNLPFEEIEPDLYGIDIPDMGALKSAYEEGRQVISTYMNKPVSKNTKVATIMINGKPVRALLDLDTNEVLNTYQNGGQPNSSVSHQSKNTKVADILINNKPVKALIDLDTNEIIEAYDDNGQVIDMGTQTNSTAQPKPSNTKVATIMINGKPVRALLDLDTNSIIETYADGGSTMYSSGIPQAGLGKWIKGAFKTVGNVASDYGKLLVDNAGRGFGLDLIDDASYNYNSTRGLNKFIGTVDDMKKKIGNAALGNISPSSGAASGVGSPIQGGDPMEVQPGAQYRSVFDINSIAAMIPSLLGPRYSGYGGQNNPNQNQFTDERGTYADGGMPQRYKSMGFNSVNTPKKTPSHDSKSHAVVVKDGGQYKLIRFGQQGVSGSPKKSGETDAYRNRRESFKSRHASNIAKGKTSAAYWANKVKWEDGGQPTEFNYQGLVPMAQDGLMPRSMRTNQFPFLERSGITPAEVKARSFHEESLNSEGYKNRIKNSAPSNVDTESQKEGYANNIIKYRRENLRSTKNKGDILHNTNSLARYSSGDRSVRFLGDAINSGPINVHEFSHATTDGMEYFLDNDIKKIDKRINHYDDMVLRGDNVRGLDPEYYNYLTEPTEVKARLDVLKQYAAESGIVKIGEDITPSKMDDLINKLYKDRSVDKTRVIEQYNELLKILKEDDENSKNDNLRGLWNEIANSDSGTSPQMIAKSGGSTTMYNMPRINQKINMSGIANPLRQSLTSIYSKGGSVGSKGKKPFTYSQSSSGPRGFNTPSYNDGIRALLDIPQNEYIDTDNLIPIQTEVDELIILPSGDITKVMATKRHSKMSDDEVTDVTPDGAYILSAHGNVKINRKEAENIITEVGVKPYRVGDKQHKPTEKTLAYFMNKSVMSPADVARRVSNSFNVMSSSNPYELSANSENKKNRVPYLEALVQLSEFDKMRKGMLDIDPQQEADVSGFEQGQPPMARNGGIFSYNIPSYQNGDTTKTTPSSSPEPISNAIGTSLAGIFNLAGAYMQNREAKKAWRDIQNITNESYRNQRQYTGLGAGLGILGALNQNPEVRGEYNDPMYIRNMQTRVPQVALDSTYNRAFGNMPNYMDNSPSWAAGLGAQQSSYVDTLKSVADMRLAAALADQKSSIERDKLLQTYADSNTKNEVAAFNATRGNRNTQSGNIGDRMQGMFDSFTNLESNRATSQASARLGVASANQQFIKSATESANALSLGANQYYNATNKKDTEDTTGKPATNPALNTPSNTPSNNGMDYRCVAGYRVFKMADGSDWYSSVLC